LIADHKDVLIGKLQDLLNFDKDQDLRRMHNLLSRIKNGLELLCLKFEEHVKASGLNAVSRILGEGGADNLEPKVYVDTLFEVHNKYAHTVTRNFEGEADFVASLDRACKEFVNRNDATSISTSKSSELLVEHVDALLRKHNKLAEENDLEISLNRVMVIFKYLEDKDAFQNSYSMKLRERGSSASDKAEACMMSKLKEACSSEYANKPQWVFTDPVDITPQTM